MPPTESAARRAWVLDALDKYERRLLRYGQRLAGGDLEIARDAVQFAYLQLCDSPGEAVYENVGAWLFRVVHHRIIDVGRRGRRQCGAGPEGVEPADEHGDPAELVAAQDFHSHVRQRIDRLPDRQRNAIQLWSEGFSYREISQIVGAREVSVRVLVHRAVQALRQDHVIRRLCDEESAGGREPHRSSVHRDAATMI